MTEDVEQVHAKLAAYINGELDPSERAEIEAHLAANPAHAQMLAELARQRQVLSGLPREAAPADLGDQLLAQLERGALLDDAGQPPARSIRLYQWQGALSMAAMVALAVGLGMLVYWILPSGRPSITFAPTSERHDRALPERLAEVDKDVVDDPVRAPMKSLAPSKGAADKSLEKAAPAGEETRSAQSRRIRVEIEGVRRCAQACLRGGRHRRGPGRSQRWLGCRKERLAGRRHRCRQWHHCAHNQHG